MLLCLDKRVGTNWSPSKYTFCVNVEPFLENPIPTMNLVYVRYESSVKGSSFFGVEKP